jgi:hypothetical protein
MVRTKTLAATSFIVLTSFVFAIAGAVGLDRSKTVIYNRDIKLDRLEIL